MHYWLFKSEPNTFSIDDLFHRPKQTEHWDGVRNYQARNMLRHDVKKGDQVLFYHSSCEPPGIVGIAEVVREGYPDFTAWDVFSSYFDLKSTPERPLWYMVDIKFVKKFKKIISLSSLKHYVALKNMWILRKGNRLSITPVSLKEWKTILAIDSHQNEKA